MTSRTVTKPYDLGDGLLLRRSTSADAEKLSQFNGQIHGDNPRDADCVAVWTRDLLQKPHPTFHTDDFLIIEQTKNRQIISSLCLIDQVWTYEGIPFKVGRPELVGTDPTFRNRGLVRSQFEIIHQWGCERGQMLQIITGIPFYYRQFGYEMGLKLGGSRIGYEPQIPKLKEGEQEPYCVRLATEADIPWLQQMYDLECKGSMVNAVWDKALWQYEILGKSRDNINRWEPCVIEDHQSRPVGYLVHPGAPWGTMMPAIRFQVAESVSFAAVTPSVIRYLWKVGQEYCAAWERKLETFAFSLGESHPVYQGIGHHLRQQPAYAFYLRVPDLPAFLTHIAPVLEARLKESYYAGHTGDLKISFYRDGINMVFDQGRLIKCKTWKPTIRDDEGSAAFPNLTFLQLLFGYRSLNDIRFAYPDCMASAEAEQLLTILFPKKPSNIWAIS